MKWILIVRKFICTLDTGLGKTLIASAVMKILHDSGETDKFLYVVENAGLIQTANKVMSYTGLRVVTCDATESKGSVLEYMKDDSYDVLMKLKSISQVMSEMAQVLLHTKHSLLHHIFQLLLSLADLSSFLEEYL